MTSCFLFSEPRRPSPVPCLSSLFQLAKIVHLVLKSHDLLLGALFSVFELPKLFPKERTLSTYFVTADSILGDRINAINRAAALDSYYSFNLLTSCPPVCVAFPSTNVASRARIAALHSSIFFPSKTCDCHRVLATHCGSLS